MTARSLFTFEEYSASPNGGDPNSAEKSTHT